MKVVRQTSEKGDTKDLQLVGLSFSTIVCVSVCASCVNDKVFPAESSCSPGAVDYLLE